MYLGHLVETHSRGKARKSSHRRWIWLIFAGGAVEISKFNHISKFRDDRAGVLMQPYPSVTSKAALGAGAGGVGSQARRALRVCRGSQVQDPHIHAACQKWNHTGATVRENGNRTKGVCVGQQQPQPQRGRAQWLLGKEVWPLFTKAEAACAPVSNKEPLGYSSERVLMKLPSSCRLRDISPLSLPLLSCLSIIYLLIF